MICESSWNESGESDCRIRSKNIASPTSKSRRLDHWYPFQVLVDLPNRYHDVLVFAANILPVRLTYHNKTDGDRKGLNKTCQRLEVNKYSNEGQYHWQFLDTMFCSYSGPLRMVPFSKLLPRGNIVSFLDLSFNEYVVRVFLHHHHRKCHWHLWLANEYKGMEPLAGRFNYSRNSGNPSTWSWGRNYKLHIKIGARQRPLPGLTV